MKITIDLNSINKDKYVLKQYDLNYSLSTEDVIKLYCARDFVKSKKGSAFITNSKFVILKEIENIEDIYHENFNNFSFKLNKKNNIKYECTLIQDNFTDDDILNCDFLTDNEKYFLFLKKYIQKISDITISALLDTKNYWKKLFPNTEITSNNKEYLIRNLNERMKETSQQLDDEKKKESEIYEKIKLVNDIISKKSNININKFDTYINLVFSLNSNIDIYEIFNLFIPSNNIPFFHAKDFNKSINDFIVKEDWIKELTEDEIYFYVKNEDYNENYTKCILSNLIYKNKIYYFDLNIHIEKTAFDKIEQRFQLFSKIIENLPEFIISKNNITYKETVLKGYMYISLQDFSFLDIPILQHYFMIDDIVSFLLSIDERSSIYKIRGGLSTFLHLYKPTSNLKQKYSFDAKLNWIYDKVGKLSKTKFNITNVKDRGDDLYDVLIIKYKKLKINFIENLILAIITYMVSNIQNVKNIYN